MFTDCFAALAMTAFGYNFKIVLILKTKQMLCLHNSRYYFRNSFFKILPVALIGRASKNSIWRGYL